MKIATWNINSIRARLSHIQTWLQTNNPDVLALQETKISNPEFPVMAIRETGYELTYSGQRSYNGVAILSKTPGEETVTDIPGLEDPQRRIIAQTINGVRIINIYVPNGERLFSEKFRYKLSWLEKLTVYLFAEMERHENVVVLGDFNIAPHPIDVHDPAKMAGHILFSDFEREAFQRLIDIGLIDCFRLHEQSGKSYSWFDYRTNGFVRNVGLRIDHILASPAMAKNCVKCLIDKEPRGWDKPSDHAPVIAEFATCASGATPLS